MRRRDSNVIEMIEPAPDRFNLSREEWAKTPAVIREEILRMHREMNEGLAILKDRRCGRRKRVRGGFWELHCCERDGNLARAEELRAALAPDEERIAANDALEEFHKMAKRNGKTLVEVLIEYVKLENLLRTDLRDGFFALCERIGFDPIDLLAVMANGVKPAHAMFLDAAAQFVRAGLPQSTDEDQWHVGAMANEIEQVLPDCVSRDANGFRMVDYNRLAAAVTKGDWARAVVKAGLNYPTNGPFAYRFKYKAGVPHEIEAA